MKILLDPYIIMTPPEHITPEWAIKYLDSLETWLINDSPCLVQLLHNSACMYHLVEINHFPFYFNLSKIITDNAICGYDPRDISRLTNNIFESFNDIEKYLPQEIPSSSLLIEPTFIMDRLPDALSNILHECICKIVLKQIANDPDLLTLKIGSNRGNGNSNRCLNIKGTILPADKTIFGIDMPLASDEINVEISILFNREDILNSIDWDELWSYPEIAMEKAYYSTIMPGERETYELTQYRIGSEFINSIQRCGLHVIPGRIKSIYETCALVISGKASNLAGIHPRPLRRANRSDGAKGRRADISQEHAGYRLHYWQCTGGIIELSCVNVHNDFSIY